MQLLLETWDNFYAFMESGGEVLLLIFAATFVMWTLILERVWYFWRVQPVLLQRIEDEWKKRGDRSSWFAHQIRSREISRAKQDAERSLPMIKTLVALCPMMGLFGTVLGMIEVFDVMAVAGNGNPRAMASGIIYAMITTMAGMVAALSGLVFSARLQRLKRTAVQRLADHLEVGSQAGAEEA